RRRLVITDAVLTRAVEIIIARKAESDRGVDKRFADRMMIRHIGHAERSAGAVEFVAAARLVLGALEIRQHILERPAGVAELTPMIEIFGLAADVHHAIDRGRAAEDLAARPVDAAISRTRIGLGLVAPVDGRIGEGL